MSYISEVIYVQIIVLEVGSAIKCSNLNCTFCTTEQQFMIKFKKQGIKTANNNIFVNIFVIIHVLSFQSVLVTSVWFYIITHQHHNEGFKVVRGKRQGGISGSGHGYEHTRRQCHH